MKIMFFTFLRGIWYYLQVAIIYLSSPLVASLYNIGTRLCSQRIIKVIIKLDNWELQRSQLCMIIILVQALGVSYVPKSSKW